MRIGAICVGIASALSVSACQDQPQTISIYPESGPNDVLLTLDSASPAGPADIFSVSSNAESWIFQGAGAAVTSASSAGRTGGIVFEIPSTFETLASGNSIRIEIEARATNAGEIAVAYSTNEVGNSGWQVMPVTTDFSTSYFEFNVPAAREGRGDFLGILPDPDNTGQTVEIRWIKLSVQ